MLRLEAEGLDKKMLSQKLGETLANFARMRNLPVFQTAGAWWTPFSHGSRFLMTVPEQITVDRDEEEIARLLWSQRMVAARFPTMARRGMESGYYLWSRKEDFDLSHLDRKLRNSVRRGLEQCQLRELEPRELRKLGLDLNRETMERQGRFNPEFGEAAPWERFVAAVERTEGMSITGAFVEDELAGYSIECRADGWWYALYQNSRVSRLKSFPNHALDFFSIDRAAKDPTVQGILNSPFPLSPNPGLHDYKTKFGYQVAPYRLVIQLNPVAEGVVNSAPVRAGLRLAHELMPENRRVQQAARFWGGFHVTPAEPGAPAASDVTPAPAWVSAVTASVAFARESAEEMRAPALPVKARQYVYGVMGAAAALTAVAAAKWSSADASVWGSFLALALVTGMMKVRLPGLNGSVGANFLITLIGLQHLSWTETLSISLLSTLFESYWRPQTRPQMIQALFSAGAVGLSSVAAFSVSATAQSALGPEALTISLILGALTLFLANSWLVSTVLGLVREQSIVATWKQCHLWSFPMYLVGGLVAAAMLQARSSPVAMATLLAVPVMYLTYNYWDQLVNRLAGESLAQ